MVNQNHDVKVNVTEEKELIEEFIGAPAPEPVPEPEPAPQTEEPKADSQGPENPIRLKHPILINGQQRREFRWTDNISSEQFLDADSRAHGTRASISTAEMDTGFHFWLGVMMIVAANPEVDPKDLEQIKGKDLPALMRLGRFFMLPGAEEN